MEELWREKNIFYNILCFLITENEKLFDKSDANLYWRTVFHSFCILHHSYIGLFAMGMQLENHSDPNIKCLYTFRGAFLTGWNFAFQGLFLTLSLIYDALEWMSSQESRIGVKLRYLTDVIFCAAVFPYTLFVTSMFWCIYSIDRELVFPEVYDTVIPWWFNHCVHTNICVLLVIETLLQPRRKPMDEKLEKIIFWTVDFGYAVVYYSVYAFTHRWLYQVFGVMNWWQITLFQLMIWGSTYLFYKVQFPINRLIHGAESPKDDTPEDNKRKDEENSDLNKTYLHTTSLDVKTKKNHIEKTSL